MPPRNLFPPKQNGRKCCSNETVKFSCVLKYSHPTPSGRHGYDRRPLVGPGVVSLCAAQLCGVVSSSDGVDHVLVDGTAKVLPPGAHGRNGVPAVLLRVVALHCGGIKKKKIKNENEQLVRKLHCSVRSVIMVLCGFKAQRELQRNQNRERK